MYSSGWAMTFIGSLTATPIRLVPWSRASMRTMIAFLAAGYRDFITEAAAFTVLSMSAALWAVEMKPASNCDGAR